MTYDASKIVWDAQPQPAAPPPGSIDPSKIVWDNTLGAAYPDANLPQSIAGIPISPAVAAGVIGAGKVTSDLWSGLKQGYNWLTGDSAANEKLAAQQRADAAEYAKLRQAHPFATMAGEVAPYIALGAVPSVAGLGLAGTAAASAAPGALSYGSLPDRLARGGFGAAGGAAGYGIGKGISTLFGAGSPETAALSAGANRWNIPLRPAQVTQNKPLQIADAALGNLPFSSGPIQQAKTATIDAWRNAVAKTAGATDLTPTVIGQARRAAGEEIGNIASRYTLPYSQSLDDGLTAIQGRITNELAGDAETAATKQLNAVYAKFGPGNTMTGESYKALDGQLGRAAKSNIGGSGNVIGDLRNTLRGAMDDTIAAGSNPADSAAWQAARARYFNATQIGNAGAATPGEISPAGLLGAVNRAQKNARFGQGNELADLAQWGRNVLPAKVPDSGTAQREWYQQFASHGVLDALGELAAAPFLWPAGKILGSNALARAMAKEPVSPLTQALLTYYGGAGLGSATGAGLLRR